MFVPEINIYVLGPLVLFGLAIWTRHGGVWLTALLGVVITIWMHSPYRPNIFSNRPLSAKLHWNEVWIIPRAQGVRSGLSLTVAREGIAYSENNYSKNCQQKTGVQLLGFKRLHTVWTYKESPWCTNFPAEVPARFSFDPLELSEACKVKSAMAFVEPQNFAECVTGSSKLNSDRNWSILLNCSQRSKQYQLRWFIPNMLTGGDALQSFAGIDFSEGECLDPKHEDIISSLLDVVNLGRGNSNYDQE
jgi:hypothetical protein